MPSIKPNDSGSQMDGCEEIASGLVVARGNSAVLFEPTKEIFDQMSRLVDFFVIETSFLTAFFRWNDDFFAGLV